MIRPAVPTDIHSLLDMGRAFFVEAGWSGFADFDDESFAYTCGHLMDNGVFLVAERDGAVVGMAAAGLAPAYWNRNVLTAQELFWYVQRDHRRGIGGKLMNALEVAVKTLGVRLFSMSAEEGLRADALSQLYAKRGYRPTERLFWKQLNGASA